MLEHFSLVAISMAFFLTEPALVAAQEVNYNPINFSAPLTLSRGEIRPASGGALYLNAEERCTFVTTEWGFDPAGCAALDALVFVPADGIDTLIIAKPMGDGYIDTSDWDASSAEAIEEIWNSLAESLRKQGERLGQEIVPIGWQVRPTLHKDAGYLFYSFIMDWDGERVINARAGLLDRHGYIQFSIVPADMNASALDMRSLADQALRLYTSKPGTSYAEFTSGDKIAAGGAVGVLAALTGVKYGKEAATGLIAVLLAFAKKLWILLLLPFVFVKRLFKGGSKAAPTPSASELPAQDDINPVPDDENDRSPGGKPPA
ncbi:hypothetical protein GCM10007276_00150 [Agaricicola taiwanensis]|uniref:DUF2167 domain-containing protein n=1 Tax=Agaricicola taiwanensis TaxID=591372 RepID=A0A8J2YB74_9RHOB|nr:hypothetical protein GCM10007276_00150 [Agaricicola taiwanensis]